MLILRLEDIKVKIPLRRDHGGTFLAQGGAEEVISLFSATQAHITGGSATAQDGGTPWRQPHGASSSGMRDPGMKGSWRLSPTFQRKAWEARKSVPRYGIPAGRLSEENV